MTIYQNKQHPERLIEVLSTENGKVAFFPQGGGFEYGMPVALFESDWELARPPQMRRALVSAEFLTAGDGVYPRFPCFFDGRAWNGWGMPYFEREAVQKIMDLINSYSLSGPQLVWKDDGIRDMSDEDEFVYMPVWIEVEGGRQVLVWGLGAGSWTWDWPQKLVRVNLQTHVGGDDLAALMQQLDIRVIDDTFAPWDVVYEGTEEDLRKMYAEHWGDDDPFPELAKEPT